MEKKFERMGTARVRSNSRHADVLKVHPEQQLKRSRDYNSLDR